MAAATPRVQIVILPKSIESLANWAVLYLPVSLRPVCIEKQGWRQRYHKGVTEEQGFVSNLLFKHVLDESPPHTLASYRSPITNLSRR